MRDLIFRPRGQWADPLWTPPRFGKLPPNEGQPEKPDRLIKLPEYPTGRRYEFPFYRCLNTAGKIVPWLLSRSPIDEQSGVYFLYDQEADKAYVGSSVGNTKQGNVRRTINRHFQAWQRLKDYQAIPRVLRKAGARVPAGGVVLDRRDVLLCVLLVPLDFKGAPPPPGVKPGTRGALPPAVLESWYISEVCSSLDCYNDIGVGALVRDDPSVPF